MEVYSTDRTFRVKQDDAYSELERINAVVPNGITSGPILFLLYSYTSDIPEVVLNTITTFADDTTVLAVGSCKCR